MFIIYSDNVFIKYNIEGILFIVKLNITHSTVISTGTCYNNKWTLFNKEHQQYN